MTGKREVAGGSGHKAGRRSRLVESKMQVAEGRGQEAATRGRISRAFAAGFTLLELMIVITIIIILAAITLPQYQRTITHTREAVLRDDLFKMRSLMDQFAADKTRLPQSLEEMVSEGYMRDVPVDPITGNKDWAITTGEDPNSTDGQSGMTDIHSSSSDISTEGTAYSEW